MHIILTLPDGKQMFHCDDANSWKKLIIRIRREEKCVKRQSKKKE